jgi:hypothetical protein
MFDTRQQIVDQAGDTPLRFRPAYRDPIAPSVLLELRRAFKPPPGGMLSSDRDPWFGKGKLNEALNETRVPAIHG